MRRLRAVPDPSRAASPQAVASRRWERVRRAAAELTPEAIEQIAHRVAELLHHNPPGEASVQNTRAKLIDASQLALHLGVTRTWVYEHANQLGAIRLGPGSKARLRFDLDTATAAINGRPAGRETSRPTSPPPGTRRRRPKRGADSATPLLPISPPRTRGILARFVRAQRRRER
jgi:hypothetical protein